MEEESELSGINYMACLMDKLKTDNIPWNTIKKTKKEILSKQIFAFIKTNLNNHFYSTNISKKTEYTKQKGPTLKTICEYKWKNFLPVIQVDTDMAFTPITSDYFKLFIENYKSNEYYHLYLITHKLANLTQFFQSNIQKSISAKQPSILTNLGIPYLENTTDLINYKDSILYDFKQNSLSIKYSLYYDHIKQISKPNIRIDNRDTKLVYNKISTIFSENTIYNTFIHYCLKYNNNNDSKLFELCKTGDKSINTKEKLNSIGITYTELEFYNLLKYLFSNNIIRNKVQLAYIAPDMTNMDLEEFKNKYTDLLQYANNEYESEIDKIDSMRNYILSYSKKTKEDILKIFSNDLSFTKKQTEFISQFFDNLENWNNINGSYLINNEDLTTTNNINYLFNIINNICKNISQYYY